MKALEKIKDFFINPAFKKWLIYNGRILKNKFNWVLIIALIILCYVDIVPRTIYGVEVEGTWASVMVTAILWGHMIYIQWMKDDFKKRME